MSGYTGKEQWMKKGLYLLASTMIFFSCSFKPNDQLYGNQGNLSPCPGSPNCVSSMSDDPRQAMPALPYLGTGEESMKRIISIIGEMKRCELVHRSHYHLHVQCKTRVFGFVDDVEFLFDDASRMVHFRSASRLGHYDFGVNRRRMSKISKMYLPKK